MRKLQLKIFYLISALCLSFNIKAQVILDSLRVDWSSAGYQGSIPSPSLIINVKNFGAYGDSVHDDYTAVINAINSSSQLRVIYFPAGKYLIQSTLQLPSNVVLRGESSNNTMLYFNLKSGDCIDITSAQSGSFTNIDSGYIKGSNRLNVSNVTSLNENSYAELREANGSWDVAPATWAKYCVGQIVKIDSVTTNSIVIEPALRITYLQSLQPQMRSINPVQNTGIECMKIIRIDSTPNNYGYNINFSYAENCWVTGVESNKSQGSHIMINASGHITVSGCYFHDAFTYDGTGTAGYGVTLIQHASDCKIENSVFRHLRHSMIAKQGANGNVFAYNYSIEPNRSEFPNDAGGDLLLHGHYAFANLFEGNINQNIIIDQTWGPSGPYNTFFRNRAELYGIAIFDTIVPSIKENFVGNEVTGSGTDGGYPLGNYYINSNNQFTYANNINNVIQPAGTTALNDSSYFLYTKPSYWNITSFWPSLGIPNAIGSGSNPAKERYLSDSIKTTCSNQLISLKIIAAADSITCNGATTAITVTASGGVSPYHYSIDSANFQAGNTFIRPAGNYTITVSDAAADTLATKISFSQPVAIKASLKKINLTCYNDSSGLITVIASGGVKPYLYNLNVGTYQSTNAFKNLKAGTYIITVKDVKNCILNVPSASITQPVAISVSNAAKGVSCKNASDGSITVTASKGTSPYQYSLSGGAYQSSNVFNGLPTGTYTLAVKDSKGCVTVAKTPVKINASTKTCTSAFTSDDDKNFDVNVFPNPTKNTFSLSFNNSDNEMVKIKITDMFGKKIYQYNSPTNHINSLGANLAAGIYFIQVMKDSSIKTFKIIKQ